MKFSKYQEAIFDFVKNDVRNMIVNAVAGSGKTTTAINAATHMAGDVIMLAFNKKIAVELESRLSRMGLPSAKGSTFHAEAYKAIQKSKGRVNMNKSKVYSIVEMFTQQGEIMKCRSTIMKLVAFAKNNGFGIDGCPAINDDEAWVNIIQHQDISIDADVSITEIIDICKEVLRLNNLDTNNIDFDDMIYFPLLLDLKFNQYDWIIVDEAQDTNVIRKLMIQRMLKDTGRLMAIGDPAQAIYGFTGAENDSMNLIRDMFDCVELPLSVCYRCGKNIVAAAQEYHSTIEAFEGADDGVIDTVTYDSFVEKSGDLSLSKKDGIICRNNAPLVALAFALIRRGIGCRIEGRDIGNGLIALTRKWKVNDLATFTLRIQKHFDREMDKAKGQKLATLEDKYETMIILIERCQSLGMHTVAALQKLINDMFSDHDDNRVPNVVVLSSIHKSKGLEFDRCFILGQAQFQPSKYATMDWMQEQERNLIYVGLTRAKNELVHVTDVPTRNNRKTEE